MAADVVNGSGNVEELVDGEADEGKEEEAGEDLGAEGAKELEAAADPAATTAPGGASGGGGQRCRRKRGAGLAGGSGNARVLRAR